MTKTTIIAAIIAVLSVVAAVLTSGTERDARRAAGARAALLTADELPIDSVGRITVARRGQERMVFERLATGGWMQVEPFSHAMDAFRMRQLVTAAREVEKVDRISTTDLRDGLTLATLGLDPPEAQITYEWADRLMTIALGRRGIAGRAYVQVAGEEVTIASQQLHEIAADMNPKEWRDRSLFRDVGVDCDRVVLTGGAVRVVLERERRAWRMIEPIRTRVDRAALERLMQGIGGARSAGFIADQPENLDRFGLAPGAEAASLEIVCTDVHTEGEGISRETREQRLFVGNPAGGGTQDRFGMLEGRPTVVRLPEALVLALFGPIERLIDPTGSGVIAADVKSVRIISDAGEVRIERDLERWFVPAPADADADTPQRRREVPAQLAHELLQNLTELRAPQVQIHAYPADLQKAVVTLFGFDARPLDTVRIAHDPTSGAWMLENGDGVLRIFPPGFEIALTPAEFGLPQ